MKPKPKPKPKMVAQYPANPHDLLPPPVPSPSKPANAPLLEPFQSSLRRPRSTGPLGLKGWK